MQNCGEDGAAERMRRRKLAGLSEPKWRLADSPKRGGEPVAQLMQVAHPLLDLESGRGALVPAGAAAAVVEVASVVVAGVGASAAAASVVDAEGGGAATSFGAASPLNAARAVSHRCVVADKEW